MYVLYGYSKLFKFKQQYQQIRPVFPDHLSVSYDCGVRNLVDEYFHFYSIAGQKFKMKEIFLKILNNCIP